MQLVLDLLVPGIIAGVSCYGMAKRVDVYDALLQGAAKGLEILLRILPCSGHTAHGGGHAPGLGGAGTGGGTVGARPGVAGYPARDGWG